jgi:hypothetical protein
MVLNFLYIFFKHFVYFTLLMHVEINGAPIEAEVKQFPGFDGVLRSKHYAG